MALLKGLCGTLVGVLEGAGTDEAVNFFDRISSNELGDNMGTKRTCGTSDDL